MIMLLDNSMDEIELSDNKEYPINIEPPDSDDDSIVDSEPDKIPDTEQKCAIHHCVRCSVICSFLSVIILSVCVKILQIKL